MTNVAFVADRRRTPEMGEGGYMWTRTGKGQETGGKAASSLRSWCEKVRSERWVWESDCEEEDFSIG